MIYFSLARETTDLLCYTIFHTLIDKRRKEISLFSTKTFYKSSLYKTFLSSLLNHKIPHSSSALYTLKSSKAPVIG